MNWRLDNVEHRHRDHPDTFQILERADRESLPIGMDAKLIFDWPDGGERMWVRIVSRHETASGIEYRGKLLNSPLHEDLAEGALVAFGPQHIANALRPGDEEPPYGEF